MTTGAAADDDDHDGGGDSGDDDNDDDNDDDVQLRQRDPLSPRQAEYQWYWPRRSIIGESKDNLP